ncbi:hypothetical protein LBWT_17750 [Leptolyngbya boryana IAM M-101]|nr:hypothetical protein LBWT_17750 [Leptolyngbya boryana IAM M-101]BAS62216.1 hypothetical protein LBDG_17750 [Leptolyngbya boryana dg5]
MLSQVIPGQCVICPTILTAECKIDAKIRLRFGDYLNLFEQKDKIMLEKEGYRKICELP